MTYDEFQASEEKPEKKKKNTKRKRSPSPPAKVRTSQIICKREKLICEDLDAKVKDGAEPRLHLDRTIGRGCYGILETYLLFLLKSTINEVFFVSDQLK